MSSFPPSAATDPNLPHDSVVPHVIGICSAMLAFVTLVVGARFWIRLKFVKGRLGADDWCILAAWLLAVAYDIDPINQTRFGLGRHIYDLPHDTDFKALLEWFFFGELLYFTCVVVTKIAVLTLYLRLAVQKTFRRLIWACMAFVTATAIASVTAGIFQCTPIHKAWDVTGTVHGSCIDRTALFFANAGIDIFQDALIYVLPMRMLYQLHIAKRQRIALMLVFAVGGFVVVTGMIRLNSLKVAENTPDTSYNNYKAAIWSSIECNIGVVCASMPTFKALIDHYFPNLINGHSRGPSKTLSSEASAHGKRGYVREISQSEIELEHGAGWKNAYTTDYGLADNKSYTVTANSKPHTANSSEEYLRGVEAHGGNGGIWKSTSVMVNHGGL